MKNFFLSLIFSSLVPAIFMICMSILESSFQPRVYARMTLQKSHNLSLRAIYMRKLRTVPSLSLSLILVGVAAFSAGPRGQNHC